MSLAKAAIGPHMACMHLGQPANALVRTAVAVVFGFMSLWHGPIMSFAKANPDAAHHVVNAGDDIAKHHHPAAHEQQSAPSVPDVVPVCYALGCFVALESLAIDAPVANLTAIGTLSPAPAHAMVPAYLGPANPPPRRQV